MPTALPTPRQLTYQEWEFGLFLHFGIRTFFEGHRDWDGLPMAPAAFQPKALDCDQWAATARAAGCRYLVMTTKHHDGFCLWPTARTDYSVAASPWRAGKGDVVADFVAACRRHGLGVGFYYSPADIHCPCFDDAAAYNEFFLGQLQELLGNYGEIDMVWFDGCHSDGHDYDWARLAAEIRRLQPNILVFNMGEPDFRWVGNELGIAPRPLWNTVERDGKQRWLPAECDCRIRLANWFYSDHDADTVKSLDELLGLYYCSVGRGANLLLNVGPDRHGLLPEPDASRLRELGAELDRRFGSPLPGQLAPDGDHRWTWRASARTLADHAVLQEDLTAGEHVRGWDLLGRVGHSEVLLARGENLGHRQIVRFPTLPLEALTLAVTADDGPVKLRTFTVHYAG